MRVSVRFVATLALAVLVSGCASFAARGYRGPKSDHFDGTRFHNIGRFSDAMFGDAVRRAVSIIAGSSGGGTRWVVAPTDTPPPRVGGGRLRVTFVNHATMHRGQIVGMIRQLGIEPPSTDLLFYLRREISPK